MNTKLKHEGTEIAALVLCAVFFLVFIARAQNVNNAMVSNVAVVVKENGQLELPDKND